MKKTAIALMLACGIANAATVTGEGEYRFGPETAENVACSIAEEKAKENAIANFIGEMIEHQTDQICRDEQCTTYRSMFSEVTGEIRRVVDKKSIVAPDQKASVCIVEIQAEVKKIENPIQISLKGNNQFTHGEKFTLNASINRTGKYAVVNFTGDEYKVIYHGNVTKTNSEVRVPSVHSLMALVPAGKDQSKEILIFLFTEKNLTFQPRYSKIEFEQMVKDIPFAQRKLVNHPISIVRR
jgi:hypothetical protein